MTPKNSHKHAAARQKIIIRTSLIGILTNVVLVIFKSAVGLVSGSIAIVLDAVNNATDVLSSVVTIIGAKLAGRKPDREHPYGHGRFEYFSALVVGIIILVAGLAALFESIPKIFQPELADYSWPSFVVILAAVATKFLLGSYVKHTGRKVNSGSLIASGMDALFDAALSFTTLIGIVVNVFCHVSIDGILGAGIALFIIYSSLSILAESAMDLLGGQVDAELAQKIRDLALSYPEVNGAYDLMLHNYGPSTLLGSLQIQVHDEMTAHDVHHLTSAITRQVFREFGVILTIGIYAEHTETPKHKNIREYLERYISRCPEILQMHGFYVDEDLRLIVFDLVIEHELRDKMQVKRKVERAMRHKFPAYKCCITLDIDTEH